jgi:hypothetical protein
MLFRPEEVHGASGIRNILDPPPEGDSHIPLDTLRLGAENLPVTDLDLKRPSAVEAGRINLDNFPGEEPADRQRFKPSLPIPFLLPIDRDPVLRRQVVKRGKGRNVVRVGE